MGLLMICSLPLRWFVQPVAPLQLSGTSASIATLVWQVACKENVLDKVQDELHQVRRPSALRRRSRHGQLRAFMNSECSMCMFHAVR